MQRYTSSVSHWSCSVDVATVNRYERKEINVHVSGTALIDVDGTLGRQLGHTLQVAAENGIDHAATKEDITDWNASVPGTDYHIGELIVEMETNHTEQYVMDMPVHEGAREALAELQDSGWTIVVCTHRSPASHPHTARWLSANGIPHDAYAHDVPDVKAEMEADVLVDDYHGNIWDAVDAGMEAVFFESPYSDTTGLTNQRNVSVVQSWGDVVEALRNSPPDQSR